VNLLKEIKTTGSIKALGLTRSALIKYK